MSEPFSVERLREMMDGAPPEMREHSTVLWAADEIERLRAENRRLMDGMELAWGIICNGRAWDPGQHDEWEAAKFRFRDDHWHPALDRNVRLHTPEQENDR